MTSKFAWVLVLLGALAAGCSQTKEPPPESIPVIPPGRSAPGAGGGDGTNSPVPAPPK